MRQLNEGYTQGLNRRHNRTGHAFQGRHKAIVVQQDAYLLELARYVVLNPVRGQTARKASDWPRSSYRAMIGEAPTHEWLQTRADLAAFGEYESQASADYAQFVAEGKCQPSPGSTCNAKTRLSPPTEAEDMGRGKSETISAYTSRVPARSFMWRT